MKLTLRQMQQVLALAEHRHFGRAAESIHVSQPALTRGIQALEERLGVRLFVRSPAGADPTDAGAMLISRARAILADCEDLEHRVDQLVSGTERRLAIAAGHYPAELCVADEMVHMMRESDDLRVTLQALEWRACIDALVSGLVELAVCEMSELPEGAALRAEPLGKHRVWFLARPGHPLVDLGTPELDGIVSHPWACSALPMRAVREFATGLVGAGRINASEGVFVPAVHTTSISLACRIAAESDVLAMAPLTMARDWIEEKRLVPLPFRAAWSRLNYGVVWSERRPPGGAAQKLISRLRARERRLVRDEAMLSRRFGLPAAEPSLREPAPGP